MTDINYAIDVTTNVDINWDELGRVFAEQNSEDQAKFFVGFYEGATEMQLAYIGDAKVLHDLDPDIREEVAQTLRNLGFFIHKAGGRS